MAGRDREQRLDRAQVGVAGERHRDLRRVGRQQVRGADVEHLVRRPAVLVVGEPAEQLVGAPRRAVGERVEHQVAEEGDELRAAGELHPPVPPQAVAGARAARIGGPVAPADDAAMVAVEAQVDLVVAVAGQRGGDRRGHLRPAREVADLGQPVRLLDRERGRVEHAHAAHAHDRGVEDVIVLVQFPVAVLAGEGGRVGRPGGALDPVHAAAGGHEIERLDEVAQRPEGDPGAVRRGRHHAGHGLRVVAAELGQRQPLAGEQPVELTQPHPGLHPLEPRAVPVAAQAVHLERRAEPVGPQQVAAGERHVRPRVARPDRAHRGAVGLRGPHDLAHLGRRRRPVDPQRLDRLVAGVVAPALALLVGDAHPPTLRAELLPQRSDLGAQLGELALDPVEAIVARRRGRGRGRSGSGAASSASPPSRWS